MKIFEVVEFTASDSGDEKTMLFGSLFFQFLVATQTDCKSFEESKKPILLSCLLLASETLH